MIEIELGSEMCPPVLRPGAKAAVLRKKKR